jgi:hypothetical protein
LIFSAAKIPAWPFPLPVLKLLSMYEIVVGDGNIRGQSCSEIWRSILGWQWNWKQQEHKLYSMFVFSHLCMYICTDDLQSRLPTLPLIVTVSKST